VSDHHVSGHYDEAWREDVVPPHTVALFPLLRELGLGPGSKVLDLGCGNGVLGQWLAGNLGCEVWGSEISEVAATHARERGYTAVVNHSLDADAPPFPGERFDVVVLCAVVEHLFAPESAIRQAHASLRDDGILVVLTPNVSWIVNRLLFLFGHWESSLLGGTRGHIRFLNQRMLARLLFENGFRDLDWSRSILVLCWHVARQFSRHHPSCCHHESGPPSWDCPSGCLTS
jgi:2-polyprenyl-3-methyl-5-hydroxy-6-metoxy-1,4-benzoquinol methylase